MAALLIPLAENGCFVNFNKLSIRDITSPSCLATPVFPLPFNEESVEERTGEDSSALCDLAFTYCSSLNDAATRSVMGISIGAAATEGAAAEDANGGDRIRCGVACILGT